MYLYGDGVGQSEALAMQWFEKAAEQGSVSAQMKLGNRYLASSEGIWDGLEAYQEMKRQYEEAAKWFRRAAEQGHSGAQHNLATLLDRGDVTSDQPEQEAAFWFRKAANAGHNQAQCTLGAMYRGGSGVDQSDSLALHWYNLAAEQGNAIAIENIADLAAAGIFHTLG